MLCPDLYEWTWGLHWDGELRQICTHLHIISHFRSTRGVLLHLLLLGRVRVRLWKGKDRKGWLQMDPRGF